MRGFLLALLIGNVVYFVWQLVTYRHQQSVVYHADDSRQLLDGERLVLTSERALPEAVADEPVLAVAAPLVEPAVPLSANEPVTAATSTSEVSAELPQPPIAAAVEPAVIEAAAVESVVEKPVDAAAALVVAGQCLYLGAFGKAEQQNDYQRRIKALGIDAAAVSIEVAGGNDYWVHIKPFANRQQALVKLRELQSKQIDSFIIPQGPFQHGISLGVFDRRENAEKRQQEIAAKGYSVEIGKNQKMLKEQWLMLDYENSTKFSQSLFGTLKNDFSFVEIKKDQCKSVAR